MTNYFNDLVEIMQKEVKLYDELKIIEEAKKDIIINNDVEALEAITLKEQGFVKTIVQLESLRTRAVDGLCREKGQGQIEKLNEIYDFVSPFERDQLKVYEQKLVRVISDIKDANALNKQLIEQSLEYIDVTLSIARELGMEDAGYGKGAEEREVKSDKGLFDAKV